MLPDNEIRLRDPVIYQQAILGIYPHAKQISILTSPAKHIMVVAGRRSGKTHLLAGEMLRGAHTGKYPRQIVIAPTYKQCMIVYDKIVEFDSRAREELGIKIVNKFKQSPIPSIEVGKNKILHFASADRPDTMRGLGYHRLFFDEAAFLKEATLQAAKPMGFDTGAPIWMFSSPWVKGFFHERYHWGLKGVKNYASFHFNFKDNPYITEEGIMEIQQDIELYGESSAYVQCEIYGNWVDDNNSYFSTALINKCIANYEMEQTMYADDEYVMGVDFARLGQDSTVIMVLARNIKTGIIRVAWIEETQQKLLTDAIGRIKNIGSFWKPNRIYLDETGLGAGPTDILKEQISNVEGMTFTTQLKEDIYSNLRGWMEKGLLQIPNYKKLVYELIDLRYELKSSGHISIHHDEKGHDDFPTALALACWYWKHKRTPTWKIR